MKITRSTHSENVKKNYITLRDLPVDDWIVIELDEGISFKICDNTHIRIKRIKEIRKENDILSHPKGWSILN